METKELILLNNVDFDNAKVIATLKATVAQGLTDAEFLLFAEHCKSTRLNPFKRDVWAIKVNGRLQLMTGINGYWTTANRHDQFDGYEEGYISKDGQELPDTYAGNDYIGAWCKVHRKDRKMPAKGVAFMAEYNKGHGNWKSMPRVMIMKCAESIALRKAFPQELNGTYTAEEMPKEYEPPKEGGGNNGAPAVIDAPAVSTIDTQPESDVWTGQEPVTGGKYKDSLWCELPADYLEYIRHRGSKFTQINAEKEISRREEAQYAVHENINQEASKAQDDFDKDELPEFTLTGDLTK